MPDPCRCRPAPSYVKRENWLHDLGMCEFPAGVEIDLTDLSAFDRSRATGHNRHVSLARHSTEAGRRRDERRAELLALVTSEPSEAVRQMMLLEDNLAVVRVQAENDDRMARKAIQEAYQFRLLWDSAAACLRRNRSKLAKPRGGDERRMLAHIDHSMGETSSGATDGWLDWLPDPATPSPSAGTSATAATGPSLFDPIPQES
jgi:hypothetical protein